MRIILIALTLFFSITYLISNDDITISNVKVMKRSKPTCERLGNVYDACQWMIKFTIENNSSKNLKSFCSIIKINKKKYEVCSSKAFNRKALKANKSRVILINLSELIKYENNYKEPSIILVKITGNF